MELNAEHCSCYSQKLQLAEGYGAGTDGSRPVVLRWWGLCRLWKKDRSGFGWCEPRERGTFLPLLSSEVYTRQEHTDPHELLFQVIYKSVNQR